MSDFKPEQVKSDCILLVRLENFLIPNILQIQDFQEAFSLFDKNSNGTITSAELGTVLRSLGSNPTEEELGKLVADINAKKGGVLDFKGFLQIMTRKYF